METKRVILATVLSLAVLMGWSFFFAPKQAPQPVANQTLNQTEQQARPAPAAPAATTDTALQPLAQTYASQGKVITVDTPLYRAEINTRGAVLEHFTLKRYKETISPDSPNIDLVHPSALAKAPMGLIWNGQPTWTQGAWTYEGGDVTLGDNATATARFICDLNGVRLTRELTFDGSSYLVTEALRVANNTPAQLSGRVAFTLATTSLSDVKDSYNVTRLSYLAKDGLEEVTDHDTIKDGVLADKELKWGAIESNYFILALVPSLDSATFKAKLADDVFRMAVEREGVLIDPSTQVELTNAYFMGPKDMNILSTAPNNLAEAVHFGFFDVIAKPLLYLLHTFYGYVGNYGVAIILLTVLIKIVFWPLSHKSYQSMQKMKKIQPLMQKIREKHADDRNRMNQEIMQLYKTYKVNPAGGCLPMLLQIPVFFGLYQALLGAIELRHAPFIAHVPFTDIVWLADLSAKDPFYVTPLIMGATMFIQQKLTPPPGDPTQAKIMLFMPVIFTFLFLNFPSGLVIYWLVNNVLSIAQQWWMVRKD